MNADIRVRDVAVSDDGPAVRLMDGRTVPVPLAWYPRLADATVVGRHSGDGGASGVGGEPHMAGRAETTVGHPHRPRPRGGRGRARLGLARLPGGRSRGRTLRCASASCCACWPHARPRGAPPPVQIRRPERDRAFNPVNVWSG
jgi:hypothetical protein